MENQNKWDLSIRLTVASTSVLSDDADFMLSSSGFPWELSLLKGTKSIIKV